MSMGEAWSMMLGNWFVTALLIVHAVMLIGFFVFILAPNRRSTRIALAVTLFGICGGMIALATGREVAIGKVIQLLAG